MFSEKEREQIYALVKRLKEGDQTAFEELYNATWSSFYYTAFRYLNDSGAAEDVTQEVFIIVNKEIEKLRNEESFILWVNQIAANRCKKMLQKMNKAKVVPIEEVGEDSFVNAHNFLPEEILADKETRGELLEVVMQLSEEQRRAILLYYYERLTTAEIAKVLGTSQHAVQLKLSRARSYIKSRVGKMGLVLTEPMMTRLFMLDADTICTPQLSQNIMGKINLSLNVELPQDLSQGIFQPHKTGFLLKNAGVALSVAAVTAAGATAYLSSQKPEPPPELAKAVIASATPEPSPEPSPEPTGIVTLEDMIGQEDAKTVRDFGEVSEKNRNEELMDIVNRHELKPLGAFVDMTKPKEDSYMMFELVKEEKRLLLCERYNPLEKRWSAAFELRNLADGLPEAGEYVSWYEQVSNIKNINILKEEESK